MILYNVTVKVDTNVHEDWLKWMKEVHIPDVMETGFFIENRICRLLEQDESDGITYAVQYICNDIKDYQRYAEEEAPRLQSDHSNRYRNQFVAFRTLLEII